VRTDCAIIPQAPRPAYGTLQKVSYLSDLRVRAVHDPDGIAQSPGFTAAMPVLLDLFGGRQSARTLHTIGTSCSCSSSSSTAGDRRRGIRQPVRSMITGKESIPVPPGAMTP
jgi:hypothetical protein